MFTVPICLFSVDFEKVDPDRIGDFNIFPNYIITHDYDYRSIMHYGSKEGRKKSSSGHVMESIVCI